MTHLIKADFNGTQVLFQDNAYLHATAIATRFGKKAKDYLKTERTQEYINALIKLNNSKGTKIPFEENQLVTVKKGSSTNGGGTWLHPKLAIDFARWLSAEFAVWCDEQIEKIIYKQAEQPTLESPYISDEQLNHIKKGVGKMVHATGKHWQAVYRDLFDYVAAPSVREIRKERFAAACEFLGIPANVGEVKADTPKLPELPQSGYHRFLTETQDGKVINHIAVGNRVLARADDVRKLMQDMAIVSQAQAELKTRMNILFGEVSRERFDKPIM